MATRKSATKNGFLIFTDQLTLFENIPDESVGKAIKLLLKNFDNMQPIQEEPFTNMAYELIATNIRRYREEQEIASMFGKRGGNPNLNPTLKGTLNDTDNSTHKQQDKTRQDNTRQESKKIDIYVSPEIEQIKKIYSDNCKNLIPINAYSLNRDLRLLIAEYLQDTNFDYEYFKKVCKKANKIQKIGDYKIDLKSVIKNHSGIYADKYAIQEEKENEYNPCL